MTEAGPGFIMWNLEAGPRSTSVLRPASSREFTLLATAIFMGFDPSSTPDERETVLACSTFTLRLNSGPLLTVPLHFLGSTPIAPPRLRVPLHVKPADQLTTQLDFHPPSELSPWGLLVRSLPEGLRRFLRQRSPLVPLDREIQVRVTISGSALPAGPPSDPESEAFHQFGTALGKTGHFNPEGK